MQPTESLPAYRYIASPISSACDPIIHAHTHIPQARICWYRYLSCWLAPAGVAPWQLIHPPLSTDHHSSVSTPEKPFRPFSSPNHQHHRPRRTSPPEIHSSIWSSNNRPDISPARDLPLRPRSHSKPSPGPEPPPPTTPQPAKVRKDATLFASCFYYFGPISAVPDRGPRHDAGTTCNLGQWHRRWTITAIPTPDAGTSSFPRHNSPQPPDALSAASHWQFVRRSTAAAVCVPYSVIALLSFYSTFIFFIFLSDLFIDLVANSMVPRLNNHQNACL